MRDVLGADVCGELLWGTICSREGGRTAVSTEQ